MIDVKKMMEQAQQVQFKLQELQEKFKDIYVEAESGGGLVKVTMSCVGVVTALEIDPSLINGDSKEELEDMVMAAYNSANTAKDDRIQEETKAMMEAMGMPPGTQLPGTI